MVYDPLVIFTPADNNNNNNNPDSRPPQHVWVRQRQDDTLFLVPEALAAKEIDGAAAVKDCVGAGSEEGKGVIVTIPPGEGPEEEEEGAATLAFSAAAAAGGEWRVAPSDGEVSEVLLWCAVVCPAGRAGSHILLAAVLCSFSPRAPRVFPFVACQPVLPLFLRRVCGHATRVMRGGIRGGVFLRVCV